MPGRKEEKQGGVNKNLYNKNKEVTFEVCQEQ